MDVRTGPSALRVPDDVNEFLDSLTGPTIFHVPGHDRSRARVVAGSLHGNEPSGLRAIHAFLRSGETPAVDLWLFVGAVAAATLSPRFSRRMLEGRRDFNRCFRPPFDDEDGRAAATALKLLRQTAPDVVVDLHNNTGRNPAYAIARRIDDQHLGIASLFSPRFVRSRIALGTFMEAFEDLAPSLTIECGYAGDPAADVVATSGLVQLARLQTREAIVAAARVEPNVILVDPVRVRLHAHLSLAFDSRPHPDVHVTLDAGIDRHNFETLAERTCIGWVRPDAGWPLTTHESDDAPADPARADRSHQLFELREDGALITRQAFVPIMMTTDTAVARSDCLFYAAERGR